MFKKNKTTFVVVIICILFFISIPFLLLFLSGRDIYVRRTTQLEKLVENNPTFFQSIFTEIIPLAIKCQEKEKNECPGKIRPSIEKFFILEDIHSSQEYWEETDGTLKLRGDLPLYFVVLSEGKLIKLFLSGEVLIETIDTPGEKKILDVLQNKNKKLWGMQANTELFRMTYLKDLYSEAEVVFPYKQNDNTIGVLIFLHGD